LGTLARRKKVKAVSVYLVGVATTRRRGCRFGIYLSEELCTELDRLLREVEPRARSRIVQEALRLYIAESQWKKVSGYVVGSINVLYDHEVKGVDARLTDTQHEYADVIVSTLHIHLDPRTCLLVIAIRGPSGRVYEFVENLKSIDGVLMVRPVVVLGLGPQADLLPAPKG